MNKKDEQLNLALKQYQSSKMNDFDEVNIIHHSLAAIDVAKVSLKTSLDKISLETPFFINAMTGGSAYTQEINEKLAVVAKQCHLAMATGSLSTLLKDDSSFESFNIIRRVNPKGVLFANFNPNHGSKAILKVAKKLKADAIQIHLNSPQEIVMREGDRTFEHWSKTINEVARKVNNLIVKEVGFGMSKETISLLKSLGVKIIDVSGRGGTNFVLIESSRNHDKMAYLKDWGQSTVISLLEAKTVPGVDIIASGGIRQPLDMIKSFILGAKAVGISGLILNSLVSDGVEPTIDLIENFKEELRLLMALVGAHNINELQNVDVVFGDKITGYLHQRNI